MSYRREWIFLGLAGALMEVLAIWTAARMDLGDGFLFFFAGYLAMFVVYLSVVHYVIHHCGDRRGSFLFVLAVAVALRVPFLLAPTNLSDDIYRYIWDGRIQREGINPYRYAPQSSELSGLRDDIYDGVNHKHVPTIYPPLMQATFAASTAFSETVVWMKGTFLLADLALTGALVGLLIVAGLSRMRVVIYAWCPLVLVEVAGNGHNDVLALALLLVAHITLLRRREVLSIGSLALCGLAKILGFVLAPLFLRSVRVGAWLALPLTVLLGVLPYAGVGCDGFRGLQAFGLYWRANDSLFHILFEVTGSLDTAKLIAGGLYAALVGFILARRIPPLRGCYLAIGALLLLSTTVHPWYLIWIVPYLCFFPNPAWLLLTATIILSYHAAFLTPVGEPWVEQLVFKVLEYGPFFLVLGLSAVVGFSRTSEKRRN